MDTAGDTADRATSVPVGRDAQVGEDLVEGDASPVLAAGRAGMAEHGGEGAGDGRADDLEITAKDGTIDGDPDGTVVVELKNRGGRSCAISGYAGVDLKTNAGSLSAKRTGEQAPSAIVKAGESTFFGINYPYNKSGGSGIRVTGVLVTPPNETKTVSLPWPGAATLPVTDGSGSPVKVGPIGSAGQGG
ncbi:DUF4232 domain-containing protein [Streptomyces luteoverticillatus]